MTETNVKRNYKDTVFRMLFQEKETLLSLYNAVNGTEPQPQKQVLKLSDAFEKQLNDVELELTVTIYNINYGNNRELLEACQTLNEYAQYVEMVRQYLKDYPLSEAVELAVDTCIRQGILRDFLKKNRAEAIEMSIFEYDEEKHMQSEREIWENAGREAGMAEGRKAGIVEGRQSGLIEGIINMSLDFHLTKQEIIERLQEKLNISAQEAEESYQKYMQEHQ